jgi:hypothetical protein
MAVFTQHRALNLFVFVLTGHSTSSTSHDLAMNNSNSAAWKVQTQTGIDGLLFEEDIADSTNIGDYDCLIAIEASSLNYRDIMIANVRSAKHVIHV